MVIRDRDPRDPSQEPSSVDEDLAISPVSQEDPTFIPEKTGNGGIGGIGGGS